MVLGYQAVVLDQLIGILQEQLTDDAHDEPSVRMRTPAGTPSAEGDDRCEQTCHHRNRASRWSGPDGRRLAARLSTIVVELSNRSTAGWFRYRAPRVLASLLQGVLRAVSSTHASQGLGREGQAGLVSVVADQVRPSVRSFVYTCKVSHSFTWLLGCSVRALSSLRCLYRCGGTRAKPCFCVCVCVFFRRCFCWYCFPCNF
jgi:hypothetical protein